MGPARIIAESLTPKPGIREQNRHECDLRAAPTNVRSWESNGLNADVAFGPFMTRTRHFTIDLNSRGKGYVASTAAVYIRHCDTGSAICHWGRSPDL